MFAGGGPSPLHHRREPPSPPTTPGSPMSECDRRTDSKPLGAFEICPKTQHQSAVPLRATPATPTTVANLLAKAQLRWLKCQELVELFNHCLQNKFPFSGAAAVTPPSGCIFLYDRKSVRFFRLDGHTWRKKNDGKTVRETHEKLKMENIDTLNCYYAHAIDPPSLQRRCYWLLDNDNYVLVHYLDAGSTGGRRVVQNWHRDQLHEESTYMSGMTLNSNPTSTLTSSPHHGNQPMSTHSSHGTAQRPPAGAPAQHPFDALMGSAPVLQSRRGSTMDDACSLPSYNRLGLLQAANHARHMVAPNMMPWPGASLVMDPSRSAWLAGPDVYGASPPAMMGPASQARPWDTVTGLPAPWDMQHGLNATPPSQTMATPPPQPVSQPMCAEAPHPQLLSTALGTPCTQTSLQEPKSDPPRGTGHHRHSNAESSQSEQLATQSPRTSLDEFRFCIWEISTETVDTVGGQKVLIVGSSSGNLDTSRPVYVDVGNVRHEAKFIQKGVISFVTKPAPPGLAKLRIVNERGEEVSGAATLRYQAPRNQFAGIRSQFDNDRDAQVDMILRMFSTGTNGARGMPF